MDPYDDFGSDSNDTFRLDPDTCSLVPASGPSSEENRARLSGPNAISALDVDYEPLCDNTPASRRIRELNRRNLHPSSAFRSDFLVHSSTNLARERPCDEIAEDARAVVSIPQLLMYRQLSGAFHTPLAGTYGYARRNMFGAIRTARLWDILKDPRSARNGGHVFLGFTQDSRFLLSYSPDTAPTWLYPFGMEMFPNEDNGITLHFWLFVPFPNKTEIVHSVKLSRDEQDAHKDVPFSAKLCVAQWPEDNSKLFVLAFWDDQPVPHSAANSGVTVDRRIRFSVIPIPDRSRAWSTSKVCEIHSKDWFTETPHPVFNPEYCMALPNKLILHGGGMLKFYHFSDATCPDEDAGIDLKTVQRVFNGSRNGGKRKSMDRDTDVYEFRVEHEMDFQEALTTEFCCSNGESHIFDLSGQTVSSHAPDEAFAHYGKPLFLSKSSKSDRQSGVEIRSFRLDIMMDKAWDEIRECFSEEVLSRKSFVCTTHSLLAVKHVLILKACFFVTQILSKPTKNKRSIRNTAYPFFIFVSYEDATGIMKYYGNRIDDYDKSGNLTEMQQLLIMNRLIAQVEHRLPKQRYKNVHSFNNYSVVESGVSLTSMVTPDGCVKISL